MRVLLDSNAYSRLMRGDGQTAPLVRSATGILVSAVVIGELLYGCRNGSCFDRNASDLRSFLDNPYVSLVPVVGPNPNPLQHPMPRRSWKRWRGRTRWPNWPVSTKSIPARIRPGRKP